MQRKLLLGIGLIVMSMMCTACQIMPEEEAFPETPVIRSYEVQEYKQATVMRGDLSFGLTVNCTYVAAKQEDLYFSLSGEYIDNVYVEEGQQVRAGDLLAELEQENLESLISEQEYLVKELNIKRTNLQTIRNLELARQDALILGTEEQITSLKAQIQAYEEQLKVPTEPEEVPTDPEDVPTNPEDTPTAPEDVPTNPEDVPTNPEDVPTDPGVVPAAAETAPAELDIEAYTEINQEEQDLLAEQEIAALTELVNTLTVQKQGQERQRTQTSRDYEKQLREVGDSLQVASLRLAELKEDFTKRQLFAGIDGTVTYVKKLKENELSAENTIVMSIADFDTTVFVVEGDQAQYFSLGDQVTVLCNNKEHEAYAVEPSEAGLTEAADSDAPIVYFKLSEPDADLKNKDRGSIQVTLDHRENVLYIDKKAVKTANGETFVYMLDENGFRIMQNVTTGLITEDYIEITSGLSEGDKAIIG